MIASPHVAARTAQEASGFFTPGRSLGAGMSSERAEGARGELGQGA